MQNKKQTADAMIDIMSELAYKPLLCHPATSVVCSFAYTTKPYRPRDLRIDDVPSERQGNYSKVWVGSLASLCRPRSACPRYVRIALTGLTRVSPKRPTCGVGHLGVTRGAWRHHERASVIARLALVWGSPEWALRGRPREAYRTHQ